MDNNPEEDSLVRNVQFVALFTCVLTGLVFSASAQDCEFRNEFGESNLNGGGEAVAAAMAMLPSMGINNVPAMFQGPYATWDINSDGIPDKDQFELLTTLLCLPEGVQHPLLDVAAMKEGFDANLALYWNLVDVVFDNEADIVALAHQAKAVGHQLRIAVNSCGYRNSPLDLGVFLDQVIPELWEGKTYGELADTLYELGADIEYLILKGLYGSPTSLLRTTLVNDLTAAFVAAAMGPLLTELFGVASFSSLQSGLLLTTLDWDFLIDLFALCGLNAGQAAVFGDAFSALDVPDDFVPDPDEDVSYYEWNGIFYDDVYLLGDIEDLIASVLDDLLPFTMPVRVVHASPDLGAIAICQDAATFIGDLAFKDISGYEAASAWQPDFQYEFGLIHQGGDCLLPLLSDSFDLDNTSTLVVLNRAINPEFLMVGDDLEMSRTGHARIRFLNASPDAEPLTLTGQVNGAAAAPLFSDIAFKNVTGYTEVVPGIYTLGFTTGDKSNKALPQEQIVLNAGSVYTVFAMGLAENMEMAVNADTEPGTVTVTADPVRTSFFAGESVQFTAVCSPELTPVSYAWLRNGVALPGETGAELSIPSLAAADGGSYTVIVEAGVANVVGRVQVSASAPAIQVIKPVVSIVGRRELASGEDLRLNAVVSGGATVLSYNWTWADGPLPGISTTDPQLVILSVDSERRGSYRVEVEVALPGYPSVRKLVAAEVYVRIDLVPMPAASLIALGLLFAVLFVAGGMRVQKKVS